MLNMLLRSELLGVDSPGRGAQQQGIAGGGIGGSAEAAAGAAGRGIDMGRGGTGAVGMGEGMDGGGATGGALTPSPNVFRFKVSSGYVHVSAG